MPTTSTSDTELHLRGLRFRLTALAGEGPQEYPEETENKRVVKPPTFFAVTLTEEAHERYLFLVQKEVSEESTNGLFVMLGLVEQDTRRADAVRLPPVGGWQRAIVPGTVHVVASNKPISLDDIRKFLNGREKKPGESRPPYTS